MHLVLKTVLNRVERLKGFVYESSRLVPGREPRIEIQLRARESSRGACSHCRKPAPGYDRLTERQFQFVPLWGIATYFRYAIKLKELLQCNLRTIRAYLLKEEFQLFWEYVSPAWAAKFMDHWCTKALRSRLEPMKKIARMLRTHRPLILNWFEARGQVSLGAVEGLNNRLKANLRKSYGFRTYKAIKVMLYHKLGALPEPPVRPQILLRNRNSLCIISKSWGCLPLTFSLGVARERPRASYTHHPGSRETAEPRARLRYDG